MKLMRVFVSALACAGLVACSGGSGSITGKVTVAGGQSSSIAVFAYGPSSGAAVTGSDGAFTVNGLADGDYVVRATVRGTDEEEKSASVTVKGGKASGDVTLAFHFSSGSVTGHVTFADGSDATGLSVVAAGPETRSAATEAGGAFTISNLKAGAYIVSVEAPNTREGRVSISVTASGTVDVGELRLTPVGHVTGTATYNAQPAVGVTVTVPGTSVSSVTDATGAFDLVNVPTGMRTVFARVGDAPFFRTGSADVTVARGENAGVALTLSDEAPKSGTVTGVVTFYSPNDPTKITVVADGLSVSAPVSAAGSFSLSVPVGTWDIVATAASYPKLVLGHVVVHEGETINLPGQRLSWFRKIWSPDDGSNTTVSTIMATEVVSSLELITVASGNFTSTERLALLDVDSGNLRFLATTGAYLLPTISRTGKYVAWHSSFVQSTVIIYTVATGTFVTVPISLTPTTLVISPDETTVFATDNTHVLRIPIAMPATAQMFPTDGGAASSVTQMANDHFYMAEPAGTNITLTQITTNTARSMDVVDGDYSEVLYGWADTGSAYTFRTLPWDGGAPFTSATTFPYATTFTSLNGTSTSPCFRANGTPTAWFCVNMNDGTVIPLPNDSSTLRVNELGTRAAFQTQPSDGGVRGFYETVLPPPASLTAIDTSVVSWTFGWMTPTRVAAFEGNNADGRKLRIVNNGTASPVDTDTADGGAVLYGPLLTTRTKSTGKWRSMLGDAAFRQTPLHHGWQPAAISLRTTSPTTKYGALSYALNSSYTTLMFDEVAGSVALSPFDGICSGVGFRSGTVEVGSCLRYGIDQSIVQYDFQRRVFIDEADESVGTSPDPVGNEPVRRGSIAVGSDGRSILLGTYGD